MMIFSYWLGLSYRLGAGECSTLGRVLTPYENILAMTNESLKHSPQETRERLEEIASEKISDQGSNLFYYTKEMN
jgi:hypothetical protein